MSFTGSFSLYMTFVLGMIPVLVALHALGRNGFIKRKLRTSLLLLVAALAYETTYYFYKQVPAEQPSNIGLILAALAVINALAALLFNPFRADRISDRYPRIVQDAVVVGAFVLIATYIAPERLFATSAIGGLVLGLALQDTLGNLFAGLAIQSEKPFQVGDWVKAANYEGKVVEVTWRATKIRTKAGMFVIIPNSLLSKDTLVNYSQPSPVQRMEYCVGLGYDAPPNQVKQIIQEVLEGVGEILTEPAPDVLLTQYADFSLNYRCRFWINDFARSDIVIDQFATLLYYRLKRAGFVVPYPTQEIRISRPSAADPRAEEAGRLEIVSKVELFRALKPSEKKAVASAMQLITFGGGELVLRQSEPGDSMFFIRKGRVRVVLERGEDTHEVNRLAEGDYFGEMALLTGEPRTATVIAETDLEVFVLSKEPFRKVLQESPAIAEEISRTIARRKEMLEQHASQLAARPAAIQQEVQEHFLARIQKFFGL